MLPAEGTTGTDKPESRDNVPVSEDLNEENQVQSQRSKQRGQCPRRAGRLD